MLATPRTPILEFTAAMARSSLLLAEAAWRSEILDHPPVCLLIGETTSMLRTRTMVESRCFKLVTNLRLSSKQAGSPFSNRRRQKLVEVKARMKVRPAATLGALSIAVVPFLTV